jgi:hypothetical protein
MGPLARPAGTPAMHLTWGKLLFLHWPVPEATLRPLVPSALAIDTYDGTAWVGVVPFTMWQIRLHGAPAMPGLSRSHELNVRTYVHRGGVPGVYFMSLDASSLAAVVGARLSFHLPYFPARMSLEEDGDTIRFSSKRLLGRAAGAALRAEWTRQAPLAPADPESLDFFLTERYCLYVERRREIHRSRIHHPRWPLRRAKLHRLSSSMLAAHGLREREDHPIMHAQGHALDVDVWRPERVD